jgi:hypothetical protein
MKTLFLILALAITAGAQQSSADTRIPPNAKIYIAEFDNTDPKHPANGFATYLAAALQKKKVPLIVVNDRAKADLKSPARRQ